MQDVHRSPIHTINFRTATGKVMNIVSRCSNVQQCSRHGKCLHHRSATICGVSIPRKLHEIDLKKSIHVM